MLEMFKERFCQKKGFIHDENSLVSLYDNMLYVLFLFRTKSQANVQDAIKQLEKLLYFQNNVSDVDVGGFPEYIHSFPNAQFLSTIRIMRILFWIEKEFSRVCPKPLKERLEKAIESGLIYLEKEMPKARWLQVCKDALLYAYKQKEPENKVLVEADFVYLDTALLSELILSYFLAKDAFDFQLFESFLIKTYDANFGLYAGPGFRLFQDGYEQSVSFYHSFMANQDKSIEAVQLLPFELTSTAPLSFDPFDCYIEKNDTFSVSIIKGEPDEPYKAFFFPLYIATKSHSFVMQLDSAALTKYEVSKNKIVLDLEVDESAFENRKTPVSFWYPNKENTLALVDGKRATCFSLDEKVSLFLDTIQIDVTVSTDAMFSWHLAYGNRPGQMRSDTRFFAYDQMLFLRPLRGERRSRVQLELAILAV